MTFSAPRLGAHGRLVHVGSRCLSTLHGAFELEVFREVTTSSLVFALVRGDMTAPGAVLARVHSACVTSESLGACDCDCAEQLDAALDCINREGRGVLFYLLQEGRGAGLAAKARDRMLVQASGERIDTFQAYAELGLPPDLRRYDDVAHACVLLGIKNPIRILTNNPAKVAALIEAGVAIGETCALERPATDFNAHYLAAKRASGHRLLGIRTSAPSELPEAVHVEEIRPEVGAPWLLRMGAYLIPISVTRNNDARALWFRLTVHFDIRRGEERMSLSFAEAREHSRPPVPLVRVQQESLLERFPLVACPQRLRWTASVRALAKRGAGCVVFRSGGVPDLTDGAPDPGMDPAAIHILRAWSGSRCVEPLVSGREDEIGDKIWDETWVNALAEAGQRLGPLQSLSTGGEQDVDAAR